jgi:transcriptional regulator with XRE-family HTH domain
MQLRDLRIKSGLTQRSLADKLTVSESFISQLERGERQMSLDMLRKYAGVISVKPEEILRALDITQHEVPVEKELASRVSRLVKEVMKKDKEKVMERMYNGNKRTSK